MAERTDAHKQDKAEADAKAKAEATKAQANADAAGFTGQVPYEAYRSLQTMADIEKGRSLQMDQTEPGGKYLAEDGKTFVDSNGKPLKDTKD